MSNLANGQANDRQLHPIGSVTLPSISVNSFRDPYEKLMNIARGVINLKSKWNGPRSILLSGIEGSGKSFILSSLLSTLASAQGKDTIIIKFSILNLIRNRKTTTSNRPLGKFLALFDFLSHFELDNQSPNMLIDSQSNDDPTIILLIDDSDIIFQKYLDMSSISSNGPTNPSTALDSAILHLNSLLNHCNHRYKETYNLLIISATRLQSNQLPKQGLGAPNFEKLISVPRLTTEDRFTIIQQRLSDISKLHRMQTPSDISPIHADSIITDWSTRLAAMLGGYTPADLSQLISKASSISTGESLSNNFTESVITWEYVLQAIALSPPKQLQNIESLLGNVKISTISHNVKGRRLEWDDFCGYGDVKSEVKKVLSRLTATSAEVRPYTLHVFSIQRGLSNHVKYSFYVGMS